MPIPKREGQNLGWSSRAKNGDGELVVYPMPGHLRKARKGIMYMHESFSSKADVDAVCYFRLAGWQRCCRSPGGCYQQTCRANKCRPCTPNGLVHAAALYFHRREHRTLTAGRGAKSRLFQPNLPDPIGWFPGAVAIGRNPLPRLDRGNDVWADPSWWQSAQCHRHGWHDSRRIAKWATARRPAWF